MNNWFNTLNEALEAEGLQAYWPLGKNMRYEETATLIAETPKGNIFISIYRCDRGLYERPIHFKTLMAA